jgi:hypothetical protein
MISVSDVRALALGLPEALEQDHHGFPSFRVRGKIFATLPDDGHLNVMIDSDAVRIAVAENPDVCAELWWGKRLACVQVDLPAAGADLLGELLTDAWRRKAPVTLVRQHGL